MQLAYYRLLCTLAVVAVLLLTPCQSHRGEHDKLHSARLEQRRRQGLREREETWHRKLHEGADHYSPPRSRSVRATNPDDIAAMKALYTSTNGAQWNNNTGWMKGDPCQDTWYGLYCIDGRILEITLVYNHMTGSLPSALAKADQLQVIRFYSNLIGGSIPPELFSMKSVQVLDLDNNNLTGGLPSSIVMPNLTSLVLYNNHLKGQVPTQWSTPLMQVLELSTNLFSGPLPDEISNSKSLQQLIVSRNSLSGSLPSSYGKLASLQKLWLFNNQFDSPTFPSSWSGMQSLQEIQADSLVGEFPDWIGQSWTKLETMILVAGNIRGSLPSSVCDMNQLQILHLYQNSFTGDLPSCFCNLRALTDIDLGDNQFTGPLPYCLGDIQGLMYLTFTRNNISGTLPDSVGNLNKLQILDVCQNMITGSVPSSYNNLNGHIYQLALCYNKLSTIEDGLEDLFKFVVDYSCLIYNNPWSCPLQTWVPKKCGGECSPCNTGDQHTYCQSCVKDVDCGWCREGPNCLHGSASGPDNSYRCSPQDWTYNSTNTCN